MSRRYSTLVPLPGGTDHHFATLIETLSWVHEKSRVTRSDLTRWFHRNHEVGTSSIGGYIQTLVRLETLIIDDLDNVRLLDFGRELLNAIPAIRVERLVHSLLGDYIGFAEILSAYTNTREPLHIKQVADDLQVQFPQWTHLSQFHQRVRWLETLQCVEQVKGRYYQVTAYGYDISRRFAASQQTTVEASPNGTDNDLITATSSLIAELEHSSVDSQSPQRFQRAVASAFRFLGYSVDERGDPGDTDLVMHAALGPASYITIVDTKSRHDGKLRDLSDFTLREHRLRNEADYVTVVAGSFANGKITRQAEEHGIVLLSIPLLCQWLELHAATPLNLLLYRQMFQGAVILQELPPPMMEAHHLQQNWRQLITDILHILHEVKGLGLVRAVTAEQLFGIFVARFQGVHYSIDQIDQALKFLSHPLVDIIAYDPAQGVSLARHWSSGSRLSLFDLP